MFSYHPSVIVSCGRVRYLMTRVILFAGVVILSHMLYGKVLSGR